ncbi:unnamed protein product, partial [Tenebrio molitor]
NISYDPVSKLWPNLFSHSLTLLTRSLFSFGIFIKGRFHGGFTSVARLAWKPLDQWEHSF